MTKNIEKTPKAVINLICEDVLIEHKGTNINIVVEKHTINLVSISLQKLPLENMSIL